MRRSVSWMIIFLVLVLALAAQARPAAAAEFSNSDLEGTWSLHAFGVYDVRGVFYFGTFDLAQNGFISGGADGAYGWSAASFSSGGLILKPNGEVGGVINGVAQDRGPFWIAVKLGWMELNKNQITFIGSDDKEYQLLVTLVRVR